MATNALPMLFYTSDLFAKKMAVDIGACFQQPESYDVIKVLEGCSSSELNGKWLMKITELANERQKPLICYLSA